MTGIEVQTRVSVCLQLVMVCDGALGTGYSRSMVHTQLGRGTVGPWFTQRMISN